jgi:hypothetical protein
MTVFFYAFSCVTEMIQGGSSVLIQDDICNFMLPQDDHDIILATRPEEPRPFDT